MSDFILTTPVAFIIFNRPDTTAQVFEKIREARPEKLYLISDAARDAKEREKVIETQKLVEDQIDWKCEVYKNYASENMGCKRRVASGITWVLEQEESVIVLEDDCIPKKEFFRFCQEMLEYYKENSSIMMVSGTNLLGGVNIPRDYTFSYFPMIWGWGTWRRAWELYDVNMSFWPEVKATKRLRSVYGRRSYFFIERDNDKVFNNNKDTWDIQWDFTRAYYHGLGIVPKGNLINNIGFNREDATHTTGESFEDFEYGEITFPLHMEKEVFRNLLYDRAYLKKYFGIRKVVNFVRKKVARR